MIRLLTGKAGKAILFETLYAGTKGNKILIDLVGVNGWDSDIDVLSTAEDLDVVLYSMLKEHSEINTLFIYGNYKHGQELYDAIRIVRQYEVDFPRLHDIWISVQTDTIDMEIKFLDEYA